MAKAKKPTGGLRYIGNGAFLPLVPARDLTPAEVEQYADLLKEAEASGSKALLYVAADEAPAQAEEVVGEGNQDVVEVANG